MWLNYTEFPCHQCIFDQGKTCDVSQWCAFNTTGDMEQVREVTRSIIIIYNSLFQQSDEEYSACPEATRGLSGYLLFLKHWQAVFPHCYCTNDATIFTAGDICHSRHSGRYTALFSFCLGWRRCADDRLFTVMNLDRFKCVIWSTLKKSIWNSTTCIFKIYIVC